MTSFRLNSTSKRSSLVVMGIIFSIFLHAQDLGKESIEVSGLDMNVDSLGTLLQKSYEDTSKVNLLNQLSWRHTFNNPEIGLKYGSQALQLSQKLGYRKGIGNAYVYSAWCFWALGNYNSSLRSSLQALYEFEIQKNSERIAWSYITIAHVYRDIGDYDKALANALQSIQVYASIHIKPRFSIAVAGSIYEKQNRLDSALEFVQRAYELDKKLYGGEWGWLPSLLGNIQLKLKNYKQALDYYQIAIPLAISKNIDKDVVDIYNSMAVLYREIGNPDSSIYYANEILQKWQSTSYQKGVLEAANILAEAYKFKNSKDSAIKYMDLSITLNKRLFDQDKQREIQNLTFNELLRRDEIANERAAFRSRLKIYALLAAGIIFLVIAIFLWRNNQQRKRAYTLLQGQKEETDRQKVKLEQALSELKSTQAQLVQSEKMASLGELTAGIAHEIQNPLNFVNNFSEVNKELLNELKDEAEKGNTTQVKAIADDVIENQEKINHHGKRADAIVKGMLQHSRISSGEKELTDINALCDEYLRLAYHGLRAKDKDFNSKLITDFDSSIGKISAVPQNIGRVLLNLINNALYSLKEKQNHNISGYEPTLAIATKQMNGKIEISVKDNGNGIPDSIKEKIFQPFFTTKPAGQGTGLGLSLAYDIVKAHGGEIKIETKEGEGSEFIIQLPITPNIP